jgi:hypothetical protein
MAKRNAATLELNHTHCRAICDEIGERLRIVLKPGTSAIPLHLLALMDRFKQLEMDSNPYLECAPAIVPTIDDMSSATPRDLSGRLSGNLIWCCLPPIAD